MAEVHHEHFLGGQVRSVNFVSGTNPISFLTTACPSPLYPFPFQPAEVMMMPHPITGEIQVKEKYKRKIQLQQTQDSGLSHAASTSLFKPSSSRSTMTGT